MLDFSKTTFSKISAAFAAAFLLAGCFQDNGSSHGPVDPGPTFESATMKVRMRVASVNALGKGAAISLSKVLIVMSSNYADTLRDTITPGEQNFVSSPANPQTVDSVYKVKGLRSWKILVSVRDAKDSLIHQDSASTPLLGVSDTASITLGLTSRFAMYDAKFVSLPDSISSLTGDIKQKLRINRLVLKIDGVTLRDSFATPGPYFAAGSAHVLSYDYVTTRLWNTVPSGTSRNLNAIHFASATVGYIAGDTIALKTTDGGSTWNPLTGLPNQKMRTVFFSDANTGAFGADSGILARTTVGGSPWTRVVSAGAAAGKPSPLLSLYADTAFYILADVVGGTSTVFRSLSGGAWASIGSPALILNGLHCPTPSNCYAVGNGGGIRKGTFANGGNFSSALTSGTTRNLRAVHFSSATFGTAVGDSGVILRTTDGATWTAQASGTTRNLNAVHFLDANNGYAAGANGTMLATTNGGSTWIAQQTGALRNINGLYAANGALYAVCDGGTILKAGGRSIEMHAYGPMGTWNTANPLYSGYKTVSVNAGVDSTVSVTLNWVGPSTGGGSITATLSRVGKVTITGKLPGTL